MEKPLLCLSWLNGQLKAMAVDRSSAVRTWDRPGVAADFTDFSNLLAEAVQKTRPEGKQVAMVLAHGRQPARIDPTGRRYCRMKT